MSGAYVLFIESDPSVLFIFTQTQFVLNVPLGSAVAFTAATRLHPLTLRACAELRRAPARRGEAG